MYVFFLRVLFLQSPWPFWPVRQHQQLASRSCCSGLLRSSPPRLHLFLASLLRSVLPARACCHWSCQVRVLPCGWVSWPGQMWVVGLRMHSDQVQYQSAICEEWVLLLQWLCSKQWCDLLVWSSRLGCLIRLPVGVLCTCHQPWCQAVHL